MLSERERYDPPDPDAALLQHPPSVVLALSARMALFHPSTAGTYLWRGFTPHRQRLPPLSSDDAGSLGLRTTQRLWFLAYFSCQFWGKARNFRGLFERLLYHVATI